MTEVKRRTVAKGAAWSVPVVLLGAPARSMAASPVPCPSIPTTSNGWVIGYTNTNSTSNTTVQPPGAVRLFTDAYFATVAGARVPAPVNGVITATANIPVVAGVTYNLNFALQTQHGYTGAVNANTGTSSCATVNTNLQISLGGQVLAQARSKSTTGSGTFVNPSPGSTCANNGQTITYAFGPVVDVAASYTATTTGTIPLRLQFTAFSGSIGNNDDWLVLPTFVSCSR